MVTQPVRAALLLFPITEALETKRKEEDLKIKDEGQPLLDPTVLWIKQTVRCLSSPCNSITIGVDPERMRNDWLASRSGQCEINLYRRASHIHPNSLSSQT